LVSAAEFLVDVFLKIQRELKHPDLVVYMSYLLWVLLFFNYHVLTLQFRGPEASMIQDLHDTTETFLKDYLAGMDQTELKIRTTQIVNDIILRMEEFLISLATEQAVKRRGLPPGATGLRVF
jgi:hypothetical protein